MCPSAPRVCSEPGGQKPVLSLSLDRIGNKFQWILNQNTTILIQENEFVILVCKMAAILSWSYINP